MKRVDVSNIAAINNEPRGTNEKYWIKHKGTNKLVKFNSKLSGDLDIMEKLSEDILKTIGIECVNVELAVDHKNGGNCCLVESFLTSPSEILYSIDSNWPKREGGDVNTNIQMCFGKVFTIFYKLNKISEEQLNSLIKQYVRKTFGDCLIGNSDGKLKNTGIIYNENNQKYRLTPSFDNGLAFYIYKDYLATCHIGNQEFNTSDVINYIIERNYHQIEDIVNNFLSFMENEYMDTIDKYKKHLTEEKYNYIINYLLMVKEQIKGLIKAKTKSFPQPKCGKISR